MLRYIASKQFWTLAIIVFCLCFIGTTKTQALTGNEFQPGRIIDDGVFFNGQALDVNTIQIFLDSKVPICDTNGTQVHSSGTTRAVYGTSRGYPPPYTCLRSYTETTPTKVAEAGLCNQYSGGTKSAAQIIYDVGAACGVSQKALIILLEKEQSLITDSWPWSIQYRSATGYGCPDTAPCDTEYYGFFNQVFNAARQFKKYERDSSVFRYRAYRDNYIQYNPNAGCGGTNVYIQNQATAGLYNYTPYQPNPSALNNLYGSGDSCGAYGNRNFWRLFNDWFGATLSGEKRSILYKSTSNQQIFAVWGNTKYYVPSYEIMISWGLHTHVVQTVEEAYLSALDTGNQLTNVVVMSDEPGSPIFLLDDGKRYPIPLSACAYDLGGLPIVQSSWKIDCFNTSLTKSYPSAIIRNITTQDIELPTMIAFQDSVWKIEDGKKRRIVDGLIIDVAGGWAKVRWMKDTNASQPIGKLVIPNDYTIRFSDSPVVYLFDNEKLNTIPNLEVFYAWGLDKRRMNILPASWNASDPLQTHSTPLQITARDPSNKTYLVDKGFKMYFGQPSQWPQISPTSNAPFALARLPEIPLSDIYLSDDGEIFTVFQNQRLVFPTMDDFFGLRFDSSKIRRVSTPVKSVSGLGYGGYHLAENRLVRKPGTGEVFIIQSGTRKYVPSPLLPLAWDKMIDIDGATELRYPLNGTYSP